MEITRDQQSCIIDIDQTMYVNCLIFSLSIEFWKVTRTLMEVEIKFKKDIHMGEVYVATSNKI